MMHSKYMHSHGAIMNIYKLFVMCDVTVVAKSNYDTKRLQLLHFHAENISANVEGHLYHICEYSIKQACFKHYFYYILWWANTFNFLVLSLVFYKVLPSIVIFILNAFRLHDSSWLHPAVWTHLHVGRTSWERPTPQSYQQMEICCPEVGPSFLLQKRINLSYMTVWILKKEYYIIFTDSEYKKLESLMKISDVFS